jgi:hypothetical protein
MEGWVEVPYCFLGFPGQQESEWGFSTLFWRPFSGQTAMGGMLRYFLGPWEEAGASWLVHRAGLVELLGATPCLPWLRTILTIPHLLYLYT